MKKKGFTLIELLAVIVILAIILVIAVPQILGVIEDSKVKSIEYSARGIDDSTRNFYIEKIMKENDNSNETIFECNGTSCVSSNGNKLSFSGQVPIEGKIMVDQKGEVYYLESLIFDDYKCYPTSEKEFECINKNDEDNYKSIYYIENLVDFALEVDGGKNYSGGKVILARNLSFNNDSSYLNPDSTSYGDINKNGTVEGLKTELTTGKGMNLIGELIVSARAQAILGMSFQALVDMLPSVNEISNICADYGCTDLNQFVSWFDSSNPKSLAIAIIQLYIEGGYYTEEDYHRHYFSGTFDGYGHSIDDIYINRPDESQIGLFDTMKDVTIQNVNLSGEVTAELYVGLLTGDCERCTFQNINVVSDVTAITAVVGGIVGSMSSGTLYNLSSISNVTANSGQIGGIVGNIYDSIVDKCSSTSTISSNSGVTGGLSGFTFYSTISNSGSNSSVTSQNHWVGGLTGELLKSTIRNCYSHGSVTGLGNAGGLVGMNEGIIKNSYSTSTVIGTTGHVGGLVGMIGSTNFNHSIIEISNCYSTGNVTASSELGGLVGQNGASSENSRTKYTLIKNSFSLGNVVGTGGAVGGLVGTNVMNIDKTFAKGNVTGTTIGNILGNPENSTYTMTNSYSISTQTLTGTSTILGATVTPSLLNTASWWQNTLNLGSSFKYEDGYYPLLYKIDEAGNVINELVEGQIKIPIN